MQRLNFLRQALRFIVTTNAGRLLGAATFLSVFYPRVFLVLVMASAAINLLFHAFSAFLYTVRDFVDSWLKVTPSYSRVGETFHLRKQAEEEAINNWFARQDEQPGAAADWVREGGMLPEAPEEREGLRL